MRWNIANITLNMIIKKTKQQNRKVFQIVFAKYEDLWTKHDENAKHAEAVKFW